MKQPASVEGQPSRPDTNGAPEPFGGSAGKEIAQSRDRRRDEVFEHLQRNFVFIWKFSANIATVVVYYLKSWIEDPMDIKLRKFSEVSRPSKPWCFSVNANAQQVIAKSTYGPENLQPIQPIGRGISSRSLTLQRLVFLLLLFGPAAVAQRAPSGKITFSPTTIGFHLETDETTSRHVPATMAGGVAVFDYNKDHRPDIFFTNGANIRTLQKDDAKYKNRLYRNDGNGVFTDVTDLAGLGGVGYDIGAAVGDYDNDGYPDLFVSGVHRNTLYHNNRDGTFTDVTATAGLDRPDKEYGPLWSVAAVWVDVNSDGLLDLFVVNYLQWDLTKEPVCQYHDLSDYCAPSFYKGLPNQLFLNNGDGTFRDVSTEWGIRSRVGKGMGVAMADYDLDGRPDLFVTNDGSYNFLFHNSGKKFDEVSFQTGSALTEDGNFISGMGVDFRDIDNDGYPDISFAALNNQTFPIFKNLGGKEFNEVTSTSGMRAASLAHAGFGLGIYDLDNDGWKDIFVSGGHVLSLMTLGADVNQNNMVFRNPGLRGKWESTTDGGGLDAFGAARNRGVAFGDFNGDGRIDVVVTAIGKDAVVWMNSSPASGHWLDIALQGTRSNRDGIGARVKIVTSSGTQYNHMTTSVGYASSSDGPIHFGLGIQDHVNSVEIVWPSGVVQTLRNVAGDRVLNVKEPASKESMKPAAASR